MHYAGYNVTFLLFFCVRRETGETSCFLPRWRMSKKHQGIRHKGLTKCKKGVNSPFNSPFHKIRFLKVFQRNWTSSFPFIFPFHKERPYRATKTKTKIFFLSVFGKFQFQLLIIKRNVKVGQTSRTPTKAYESLVKLVQNDPSGFFTENDPFIPVHPCVRTHALDSTAVSVALSAP